MSLHKIQQFILSQLSEHDTRRYSDMRPATMEASQFMYHLNQLMKRGLVNKLPTGGYALSAQGWLYVDRADDQLGLRSQPRIGALVVCRHPQKGLLYMRRGIQPARGYIGNPLIDVPLGFSLPLTKFVNHSFQELTGIRVCLEHRADGYINLEANGELAGSLLAHVFEGEYEKGELLANPLFDFCWESDLNSGETDRVLASTNHIIEQLESRTDRFFFDYSFEL